VSQSLVEDRGHREVYAGGSGGDDRSRAAARADRHDGHVEDLGVQVYGSEGYVLPGMGEKGPRCGEYYPGDVCPACGDIHYGSHNCGRRSCPDCWGIWAKPAALRATVRIQAFRETQPDNYLRQLVHTTVSPPEGAITTIQGYREGRSEALDLAKEKGIRGGAVVPHPFRPNEKGKTLYREETGDDPDAPGLWVWLRNTIDDWREFVEWSPHYHVIGMGTPDMDPGGAEKDGGWLYHFIGSFDRYERRDRASYESVYGAFRYLLSHTGWHEDDPMDAVTWFGDLANNKFVDDATASWQIEKPPDAVMRTIERIAEEVAGGELEEDRDGAAEDEDRECSECGEVMIDVFDVPVYLDRADPDPEVRERMQAAYDWRLRRSVPPPGLRFPQTEEQAREAFEAML